jgi:2-polyprenyl-6-methoxyphenol hydroxylase-like FAD-dependent oxidoreductase
MVDHAAASSVHMLWQTAVTGLHPEGAMVAGELVRARWVVGADGTSSRVRAWANLDRHELDATSDATLNATGNATSIATQNKNLRFGFRRHYRVTPWTDFMELYWGRHCQVYVTPVSHEEVCVALVSSSPKLRLGSRIPGQPMEDALGEFPELLARLKDAESASNERGAITVTRRLRRVFRGRTVLVGDASGGVDAITGEGLCLGFRQAALLGECLASGDLAHYQKSHRALMRRPALMARMMLFLANHPHLRQRTMQVFQSSPRSFAGMLAMHVGAGSTRDHIANGIALGWELLKA